MKSPLPIFLCVTLLAFGALLISRDVASGDDIEKRNAYSVVKLYCKVKTQVCKDIAHEVLDPVLIEAGVDTAIVDKAVDLWLLAPI